MKNPFGITERKCLSSDHDFFVKLIKETMYPIVTKYQPFNMDHVHNGFKKGLKETKILMKGKRRIGFYQLTEHGKDLEITRMYLSPSYRGKGIGTWYMKYFETLRHKKIFLGVWDNNPALRLYKKLGYMQTKKVNHKIHMEKRL